MKQDNYAEVFCPTDVAKHFSVSVPIGHSVCHLVDSSQFV